jgi:uncharacterized protein (TIGR02594 family)
VIETALKVTPYDRAKRFISLRELEAKGQDHPWIQAFFTTCGYGPNTPDETAWCSALVNGICWLLEIPHSGSAAARSWLRMGREVNWATVARGFDVVVLKRGDGQQPGPEVLKAPGHVGFYHDHSEEHVWVLGGNQSNAVSIARYPRAQVLGLRRLVAA